MGDKVYILITWIQISQKLPYIQKGQYDYKYMSLKIYIIYVNTKVLKFIFFGLHILSPLNHSESTDFLYVVPLSSLRKKPFVHLGVLFELHNS